MLMLVATEQLQHDQTLHLILEITHKMLKYMPTCMTYAGPQFITHTQGMTEYQEKQNRNPYSWSGLPFFRTSSLISTIYTGIVSHNTAPTSIGRGVK